MRTQAAVCFIVVVAFQRLVSDRINYFAGGDYD